MTRGSRGEAETRENPITPSFSSLTSFSRRTYVGVRPPEGVKLSYRADDGLTLPRFPEPDERQDKIWEALQVRLPRPKALAGGRSVYGSYTGSLSFGKFTGDLCVPVRRTSVGGNVPLEKAHGHFLLSEVVSDRLRLGCIALWRGSWGFSDQSSVWESELSEN